MKFESEILAKAIKFVKASGVTLSHDFSGLTSNRTITYPDKSDTVAYIGDLPNPAKVLLIENDYTTSVDGGFGSVSSNGGFSSSRSEIGYPGITALSTGSATNGSCSSVTGLGNSASPIIINNGSFTEYLAICKIPVLPDVGNAFDVNIGFQTSGAGIGFDAIAFTYDQANSNIFCKTVNNGSTTSVNSGVTLVANTWYKFKIEIADPNTSARFYINNSLVATISTNIPLSPRMVGAGVDISKTAGTTGRDVYLDYQRVKQIFYTTRDLT
jgi:hypothetical protein